MMLFEACHSGDSKLGTTNIKSCELKTIAKQVQPTGLQTDITVLVSIACNPSSPGSECYLIAPGKNHKPDHF